MTDISNFLLHGYVSVQQGLEGKVIREGGGNSEEDRVLIKRTATETLQKLTREFIANFNQSLVRVSANVANFVTTNFTSWGKSAPFSPALLSNPSSVVRADWQYATTHQSSLTLVRAAYDAVAKEDHDRSLCDITANLSKYCHLREWTSAPDAYKDNNAVNTRTLMSRGESGIEWNYRNIVLFVELSRLHKDEDRARNIYNPEGNYDRIPQSFDSPEKSAAAAAIFRQFNVPESEMRAEALRLKQEFEYTMESAKGKHIAYFFPVPTGNVLHHGIVLKGGETAEVQNLIINNVVTGIITPSTLQHWMYRAYNNFKSMKGFSPPIVEFIYSNHYPYDLVERRARWCMGVFSYNVMTNNCENYCTWVCSNKDTNSTCINYSRLLSKFTGARVEAPFIPSPVLVKDAGILRAPRGYGSPIPYSLPLPGSPVRKPVLIQSLLRGGKKKSPRRKPRNNKKK